MRAHFDFNSVAFLDILQHNCLVLLLSQFGGFILAFELLRDGFVYGLRQRVSFSLDALIAPAAYLATLALAYGIGGRISNHGLNVAYNWSVKWALFVAFLYLTSLFLKDAFVYAMFSFIFINIILNPMLFIFQDEATT